MLTILQELCGCIFLPEKFEAFFIFLQFKTLVEKQSECEIKTLQTDHGGEFIFTLFMEYCKKNSIQRQLTVQRSLQQHGVAERKNETTIST